MTSGDQSKYYIRRKTAEPPKFHFEGEYWGQVKDPDGKLRNLVEERDKRYKDYKDEIDFINRLNPGKILDVGCGYGYALSWVSDKWERHGTELSNHTAKVAQKYAKIFIGKLEDAKYPDNYFDVVSSFHVLEHVEDPVVVIREIYRILKPNGHLILQIPDFDSALARRFKENYRMLHDKTHINLFSTHGLRLLLEDNFFKIDRIEYPYFESVHFTQENLMRLFDTSKISPPFYGNVMSFYSRKIGAGQATAEETIAELLRQKNILERETIAENLPAIQKLAKAIATEAELSRPITFVSDNLYAEAFRSLVESFGLKSWRWMTISELTRSKHQFQNDETVILLAASESDELAHALKRNENAAIYLITNHPNLLGSVSTSCKARIAVKTADAASLIETVLRLLSSACQLFAKNRGQILYTA